LNAPRETNFPPTLSGNRAMTLASYCGPQHTRSLLELAITAIPFAVLWATSCFAVLHGYWWVSLLLAIPASGFLVRLFAIQHDCGHGSFFRIRSANDWIGRVIGVVTLTPYDFWRRTHAVHHATTGDLERRGVGDIDTLTVDEFQLRSRWGRFAYRLYRHPIIMIGIGPAYLFFLQHRFPVGLIRERKPWLSAMATNGAIAAVVATLMWTIGVGPFLLVHLPLMLMAASVGGWMFYIQHQFEATSWHGHASWQFYRAALKGSSYYDLPIILRWFTANLGIHHVHHLCSRIPYYRLPLVLRDYPELKDTNRISLRESLACLHLALWDEHNQRLVSFRQARLNFIETPSDKKSPVEVMHYDV
jgi:omega-6 fatty acid desaturase (delta-12 desaturase)